MQKIHFKDNGQDLLWIAIDDIGIIIDCNIQKSIWRGTQVLLKRLEVGKNIWINCEKISELADDFNEYDFEVEKIEPIDS